MIDTFSANSLKILEKDKNEFINKYIHKLSLFKKDERAILGQNFHALICMFLKGFDISKMVSNLDEKEQKIWENIENKLTPIKNNFIEFEFPFLIKCELKNKFYYLTGRFDAIYRENNEFIIWDWKTLNFPKNPTDDLQTVVYFYCLNQIYKTEKIKMRYFSLEKNEFIDINFENIEKYKNKIDEIVSKILFDF